jgi:hypothetical protein
MWPKPENDQFAEEVLLAGELVPPGIYRQIGTRREVHVTSDDCLPASLDGRVACYVRVHTWGQIQAEEESRAA